MKGLPSKVVAVSGRNVDGNWSAREVRRGGRDPMRWVGEPVCRHRSGVGDGGGGVAVDGCRGGVWGHIHGGEVDVRHVRRGPQGGEGGEGGVARDVRVGVTAVVVVVM